MNSRRSLLLAASSILLAENGAHAFTATPSVSSRCTAPSSSTSMMMGADRRNFLNNISKVAAGVITIGISGEAANALDMDAFVNSEIANDTGEDDMCALLHYLTYTKLQIAN